MTLTKARETSSDATENGTIESIVFKSSYNVPKIISGAPPSHLHSKRAQISKLRIFDLEIGPFDLEYDLKCS